MNRTFLDKRIVFLPEPQNVKLLLCAECGIQTVHHGIGNSNAFSCWCGSTQEFKGPTLRSNHSCLTPVTEKAV